MSIEVTSVVEPRRVISPAGIVAAYRKLIQAILLSSKNVIVRSFGALFLVALIVGADSLIRSYKYYARVIDARLASGYLTSRPGLYAAPRVLTVGQRLSQPELVNALRRAGYIESPASDVWSGSFFQKESAVEIRPSRTNKSQPTVVTVGFAGEQLSSLTGDIFSLNSFKLEPEALSNDVSSKAGKREALAFDQIPRSMLNAILAIEDRRFFEHSGVDFSGLVRAALRNAGEERISQGGSTITQQLVKNTYLSPERTIQRKYAETMLALALERRLSKQDIFALYCNEVYLGQRGAVAVRGIKEASEIFFGKELQNLSLSETATIAGMIQGPTRYSPLRHPEATKERRNTVLQAMLSEGYITREQATEAANASVVIAAARSNDLSLAPYFVDYVNRIAETEFDASGFSQRIYTTIDLELQQSAETALQRQLDRLNSTQKARPQGALVALDPHTGNILAMVGGRSYAESQLNRATDAKRQPGSTFKPFVYAAALEDGMSPVQPILDAPREFTYNRTSTYRPANYGGGYTMKEVPLRTGLVKSLNVVTVDVALQTGLARIANLAERFGLPKPERYPALALGTEEATPLQMAEAYSAFVTLGRRVESRAILSIGDPPGTHLQSSDEQVISPTTAYMITNTLQAVVDHGTAKKARGAVKGVAIAGKTGTSRDGWFIGYSPNLVCAVWIGFDDNKQLGLTGAEAALPAWVDFMNSAIAARPDLGGENFLCPEGIRFVEIDSQSGMLATLSCPLRELIAVSDRTAPNLECYLHGTAPVPSSPYAEESEEQTEGVTVAQHQKKPKDNVVTMDLKVYKSTGVTVDARGRRSLVNEMR